MMEITAQRKLEDAAKMSRVSWLARGECMTLLSALSTCKILRGLDQYWARCRVDAAQNIEASKVKKQRFGSGMHVAVRPLGQTSAFGLMKCEICVHRINSKIKKQSPVAKISSHQNR